MAFTFGKKQLTNSGPTPSAPSYSGGMRTLESSGGGGPALTSPYKAGRIFKGIAPWKTGAKTLSGFSALSKGARAFQPIVAPGSKSLSKSSMPKTVSKTDVKQAKAMAKNPSDYYNAPTGIRSFSKDLTFQQKRAGTRAAYSKMRKMGRQI